ncbi:uncharacterized protein [Henckelia pumila]|uniref:uncharacterized protein n=1 Tax=Henckelia pumila TaxID=405737 RepID=UPI003C6E00D5
MSSNEGREKDPQSPPHHEPLVTLANAELGSRTDEEADVDADPKSPPHCEPFVSQAKNHEEVAADSTLQLRRPPPTEYCVEDEPKMIVFSHLTPVRERKVLRSSAVSTPFHAPMYGANTALQGQEFEKRYLFRVRRDWPKWLEYDHMTECIRGLLSLQKLYPEILAENVSLMNVNFAQLFQTEYSSMDKPIDVEQLTSHIIGCVEDWPSSS